MVGDYVTNKIKSEFCCENNHNWFSKPNDVIGGSGCPVCSDTKLTKEIINERISHRGITLVGNYINNETKSEFRCENNHNWMTTPNHLMSGIGCPECAKLSKEIINERISHRGITMVDDYINIKTKSRWLCQHGHQWVTTPNGIMNGNGCPTCAFYGYDPNKPGTFYILDFVTFIKYGITNNLFRRLNEHKKNGEYIVAFTKLFEDGIDAKNLERFIKQTIGGSFVTKEQCPDGYTETLCSSKLKDLLAVIE